LGTPEPRTLPEPVAAAREAVESLGAMDALAELDLLAAEHPDMPDLRALAVLAALGSGDLDGARSKADALLAEAPCAACFGACAMVASVVGDHARRDELILQGEALDSDHYLTLDAIAERALQSGDLAAALRALQRSLALYPQDRGVLRTMAIVHRLANDTQAEAAILDTPPDWFRGSPPYHRARCQRALSRRDLPLAEAEALSAIAAMGGRDAQAWSDLALVRFHLNKVDDAEQAANNALELHARQANAFAVLASVAESRGDAAAAENYRRRAAEAIPALRGQALLSRGNAAMKRGDVRRAEAAYREAERSGPSYFSRVARGALVLLFVVNERWANARKELDRALDADGPTDALRCMRMQVLEHEGRTEEADLDLNALICTPQPSSGAIAPALGMLKARGRDEDIARLIEYVHTNLPGSAADLAATIMALDHIEMHDDARKLFEVAERRYPSDEALRLIAAGLAAQDGRLGHFKFELTRLPRDTRRRLFGPGMLLRTWFWRAILAGILHRRRQ